MIVTFSSSVLHLTLNFPSVKLLYDVNKAWSNHVMQYLKLVTSYLDSFV